MKKTKTAIVGASAAGLACARSLMEKGQEFILLEKTDQVGTPWRNHYDRLRLHTNKGSSNLPYFTFGKDIPKYPSRDQVLSYLEDYARQVHPKPVFNTEVRQIKRIDSSWEIQTNNGLFKANNVIIATGSTNIPHRVQKPGLSSFPGTVMHSAEYTNGKEFDGKNVLVIGFGNSACEIAICLHEHGAKPSMSVRSPVNVIPKEILGIPVLSIGIAQAWIPPKIADALNKPLLKLLIGDITKYGLKKLPYGPAQQIIQDQQIPLLDMGTMKLIKEGKIEIFGDIKKIENSMVHFDDDSAKSFDAIIMATGYKTGIEDLIKVPEKRMQDIRLPIKKRAFFGQENLFFCGYFIAPTGMLREIGIEAKQIARHSRSNSN